MELLFEYMSFIFCIHKIAKKKLKIDVWIVSLFFIEWIVSMCSNIAVMTNGCRLIVFSGIFLYTKTKIVGSWKKTISVWGMMLIVIMSLQVVQYYLMSLFLKETYTVRYAGIIVNFNICLLICLWKEKYKAIIVNKFNKIKGFVVVGLIFIRIFYLVNHNAYADFGMSMQFLFETVGLCAACILWISAEKEKNHKIREVQMYETYNKAFEEAIITIRTHQHEFENHINAIKCLQYSIKNHEELLLAQEQYCEKILQENKLNKLLKLNLEPVLIGFLYSKITSAEEKRIQVKFEIQSIDIKEKIAIYEFVELIGILFDNAVEALEEKQSKKIILKLQLENEKAFLLEIANTSPVYSNSEIEKFCSYGYSTKGENRGIGLSRVREISRKYNAIYQIQNCMYEEESYLSFKLRFN